MFTTLVAKHNEVSWFLKVGIPAETYYLQIDRQPVIDIEILVTGTESPLAPTARYSLHKWKLLKTQMGIVHSIQSNY